MSHGYKCSIEWEETFLNFLIYLGKEATDSDLLYIFPIWGFYIEHSRAEDQSKPSREKPYSFSCFDNEQRKMIDLFYIFSRHSDI